MSDNLHQAQPSSVYPGFAANFSKPEPEQLLLEWEAHSRSFKSRGRQYYTTVFLIVFLISLILIVLQQFLSVAVVISIGFVAYVFSAIPPNVVHHQLTSYGIRSDDQLYLWGELGRYWYELRSGAVVAQFELGRFPHRVTLLLGEKTQEQLDLILAEVLLQERPPASSFEKAASWLSTKIPIDLDK